MMTPDREEPGPQADEAPQDQRPESAGPEKETRRTEGLPFGVGRLTRAWVALVLLGLIMSAVGLYAYQVQLSEGEIVTGMRDVGRGAAWGLYIVMAVYFIGVSFAGITVAALIRLLNLTDLRPVARMAELLTVITILLGSLCILADLGQPLRGPVNLLLYARPQSPFFGTFTMVIAGYLFASLVFLFLASRKDAAVLAKVGGRLHRLYRMIATGYRGTAAEASRHSKATFWLSVAILPILVTAHSTLGFVFGVQSGRPGWFSALQAPAFVLLAGVSGIGLLIIVAALVRSGMRVRDRISEQIFKWLARLLLAVSVIYLYLLIAEWMTATYTGYETDRGVEYAVIYGEYSWIFWTAVVTLAVPSGLLFLQYMSGRFSIGVTVLSAILLNVSAIAKRYVLVVPSQTHGTLLPYAPGSYAPTWVEYGVVIGVTGLGILLFLVFIKLFPIIELDRNEEGATAPAGREARLPGEARRVAAAVSLVVTGVAMMIFSYFVMGAPWGEPSGVTGDPRIPGAAGVFILGVILVFVSAVVYELIPDREQTKKKGVRALSEPAPER